jgi:hypothetical protein
VVRCLEDVSRQRPRSERIERRRPRWPLGVARENARFMRR